MRPAERNAPGVFVPHPPRWFQRLAAQLAVSAERLVTSSMRSTFEDPPGLTRQAWNTPTIFCLWHNRLALAMWLYRKFGGGTDRSHRMAALVSASKDGALLADILQKSGVQPVRGSSSRRGSRALLELARWAERGYDIAITPDGPRGPRYVVQDGIIALAQLTGLPIVPVSAWLGWKLQMKSWDRFQLPLPGSRCEVRIGTPLFVPRRLDEAERTRIRTALQDQMRSLTRD
jgi:lysophospholipid acyltransferase (LPLAT)-like uncharacterized protein